MLLLRDTVIGERRGTSERPLQLMTTIVRWRNLSSINGNDTRRGRVVRSSGATAE